MNINLPLISVITVVYNNSSAIETTIQSVVDLTYPNIDYIIIDGGSADGTVDVIKKYESKLKYWLSEPDKGIYDAMNKGWAKASDDSYILFLGAGDYVMSLPDMSKMLNADIIYGNVHIGKKYLFRASADFRLRLGNTVHHQAMLVKKSVHLAPPFSLDYPLYGDFDFNQRLLKEDRKFKKDDQFLSYALEDGITSTFNKAESLQIVKRNYGFIWALLAWLYYSLQKRYYYLSNKKSFYKKNELL
jgi:glycosyltransferase involved in cell wall biosynthesis